MTGWRELAEGTWGQDEQTGTQHQDNTQHGDTLGSAGFYLRDDGELRAQVMEANVCYIESVNEDLTLRGLQDPEQAESHGRFASPSAAHNAYLWCIGGAWERLSGEGTSRFPSDTPDLPTRGCVNVPRHKYLLPTLHVQSQVLQDQLEARAVPH